MGYRKATDILPIEIVELIQNYVSGENLYIPKKENQRSTWGSRTKIRQELHNRNHFIFEDYQKGSSIKELSEKYFLSDKSIQRIIREMRERV